MFLMYLAYSWCSPNITRRTEEFSQCLIFLCFSRYCENQRTDLLWIFWWQNSGKDGENQRTDFHGWNSEKSVQWRLWIYTRVENVYQLVYHVSHIDIDTIASWNWVPWIVDTKLVYEFEKFSAGTSTTLVPHFRTDLCTRTRLLYQRSDTRPTIPV